MLTLYFLFLFGSCIANGAITSCDPDGRINIYINSSNPYCTKYSGNECTCCGYSGDNLFNYNSMCTTANPGDLVQGEHIIKSNLKVIYLICLGCDINCESGDCQNGICQKCKSVGDKKFYQISQGTNGNNNYSRKWIKK